MYQSGLPVYEVRVGVIVQAAPSAHHLHQPDGLQRSGFLRPSIQHRILDGQLIGLRCTLLDALGPHDGGGGVEYAHRQAHHLVEEALHLLRRAWVELRLPVEALQHQALERLPVSVADQLCHRQASACFHCVGQPVKLAHCRFQLLACHNGERLFDLLRRGLPVVGGRQAAVPALGHQVC